MNSPAKSRSFLHTLPGWVLVALTAALLVSSGRGQTMSVTDLNSTFTPVLKIGDTGLTYLKDPSPDQQTGTGGTGGDSDFVGVVDPSNTAAQFGFLMKYGKLASDPTGPDYVMFRFRLDTWRSGGYNTITMIGADADYSGSIDIFFGVQKIGPNVFIVFQDPGTGLNTSPNTTSLDSPYGSVAATSTNVNYSDSTVLNSGADGSSYNGTNDALLTFAITFSSLQSALNTVGSGRTSAISISDTTPLRWIGFTATQNNSINQDVYGIGKLSSDDDTTDSYATNGDTPYVVFASVAQDAHGHVPEPATVVQLAVLILAGAAISFYRLRQRQPAVAPAKS